LTVDAHGLTIRNRQAAPSIVTPGAAADCGSALNLIEGMDARALLADRAYDTDEILTYCEQAGD